MRWMSWVVLTVGCAGAGAHGSGATPSAFHPLAGGPTACAAPWALGVIGGGAQVVVMCPSDVRRAPLDPAGPLAPMFAPAVDLVQARVCDCAGRIAVPPFVDLVFTSRPSEGRVSAEAKADDEEPDASPGPAFVACVGTVEAQFDKRPVLACGGPAATSVVYPVRVDLEP